VQFQQKFQAQTCGTSRWNRRGQLLESVDGEVSGENVHRHVHQYGTRPPAARQVKGAFHDAWQIFGAIYPVDSFAKWTVDLKLIRILMEINFLVWVPAVIMRRYITGDEHGFGDAHESAYRA